MTFGLRPSDNNEVWQLKEQVTRQDKRLTELESQLSEVLSWKRKVESILPEFQSLERKVEEVVRICEERNLEASRKTKRALMECAKQRDLEELSRNLAQLKESQCAVQVRPAKSLEVIETKHAGLPPLNKSSPAKPAPPTFGKRKSYMYKPLKPLDGIIAHLTREYGGNVHDEGIVYVIGTGWRHSQVVEFENKDSYYESSHPNTWICYDFGDRRVIPTSYSVRSHNECYLKFWVIEVSNDGYLWTEIDRRDDNNDLNGEYATANFKIPKVPRESFRFFRLRRPKDNDADFSEIRISALEIFGTLSVTERIEQRGPRKQEFVCHADRKGQFPPPLFPPKLDGIIAHLTRECGGNVHDKGIVNVTASSLYHGGDDEDEVCRLKSAVDLGTDSCYCSNDEKNTWICYDFKERRVRPTSYSIRKLVYGADIALKSWVIEVSNDGSLWTKIDHRDNDNALIQENMTVTFIAWNHGNPSESFRFFRLTQTGPNHAGEYYVGISSMEIFGTLFEK